MAWFVGHCFPLQLLRAFNYREIVFLFGFKCLILAFFVSLALKFKYQSGLLVKGSNVSAFLYNFSFVTGN